MNYRKLLIILVSSLFIITALANNIPGYGCGASDPTPTKQRPELISLIEELAQKSGSKIDNIKQLKPGDIILRTNWYRDAKIDNSILSGHSIIYVYKDLMVENNSWWDWLWGNKSKNFMSARVIDLRSMENEERYTSLSLNENMFNMVRDNPNMPERINLHIYDKNSNVELTPNFTRSSALVYKLNITENQLNDAIAIEKSRLLNAHPMYGAEYNCHSFICNVLKNL